MKYEAAIGLEVHVQLKTVSKMFCACSTEFGAPPNTNICPVCLGYPGAMPVMNERGVFLTVLTGLMIGSKISRYSQFDRKSYFYPDMPKNYQISQYDRPLCDGGEVSMAVDGLPKTVRITRIHLEEDVAKNMHFAQSSGVDFNRAWIPLMEIVTQPDMTSAEEAQAFLLALKQIVEYVGSGDCGMEKGNMRCDVNCSVRPIGQTPLGTKTEIKNLNTVKGVFHALKHEISRQIEVLEGGGRIVQETRRWDVEAGVTESMRSKEDAHDYRYFPEPDLLPVVIAEETLAEWQKQLPELPRLRRERFSREFGIPEYDSGVLVADRAVADFYEAAARKSSNPKAISNWIMTDLLGALSPRGLGIQGVALSPQALADLVRLVDEKIINMPTAKELFAEILLAGGDPVALVRDRGLGQVSDTGALESLVLQAIQENPKSVADYRAGKKAAAKHLVGQIMKLSRGKANPQVVTNLVEKMLSSDKVP
jgi:aspartyl-tRNA(Asn)/glutamyl-tRNA(Gln) amidotransferase subunit B